MFPRMKIDVDNVLDQLSALHKPSLQGAGSFSDHRMDYPVQKSSNDFVVFFFMVKGLISSGCENNASTTDEAAFGTTKTRIESCGQSATTT